MKAGSVFSVAYGVAWRVLNNVVRNPAILLPSMIFPLFFFTAFAGGLSRISHVPGFDYEPGYTAFQFVFVLLQSAAFGGVFTGFGVARDFEYGFARRLLLAAPRRSGIIVGYAAAAFGRWLMTVTLLVTVALLAGMQIGGDGIDLFGLFALAFIVNVAGVLWALGIAMRFRSIQSGPLMQMPVFLTLFFAPVYVPRDLLDGWIEAVATVNPATRLLEAGRALMAGDTGGVMVAFLVAVGLAGAFSVWAVRGLRKAEAAGG